MDSRMTFTPTQLVLLAPPIDERSGEDALRASLTAGPVSAVILPFLAADERSLVKRIKQWAPLVQEAGAAAILALPETALPGGPASTEAAREEAAAWIAGILTRGGADGAHVGDPDLAQALRGLLKSERIVGVGGLRSRHDCMSAGEAGVDYLMFGEPRADGSLPAAEGVIERAQWWAEIFATPCIVYAPSLGDIAERAMTRAEFVALGDAVFADGVDPAQAVRDALEALAKANDRLQREMEQSG